jgi:hypothetical protein
VKATSSFRTAKIGFPAEMVKKKWKINDFQDFK